MKKLLLIVRTFVAAAFLTGVCAYGASADSGIASKNELLPNLGTFYFPGWRVRDSYGPNPREPWSVIKPFPERQPKVGWYNEGDAQILSTQLRQMREGGLSFVFLDWYWQDQSEKLGHVWNAWSQLPNREGMKIALMWANHRVSPTSLVEWDRMVEGWVHRNFADRDYLIVDGKPVFMIFSPEKLDVSAGKLGLKQADLLARFQGAARRAGWPGVYIVGNSASSWPLAPRSTGYSALSGYVYRSFWNGRPLPAATNLEALYRGYKENWNWLIKNSDVDYWPPAVMGWDARPWVGTSPSRNDSPDACCSASLPMFSRHVADWMNVIQLNRAKTKGFGVVCCWNEYGEGNYLEPTMTGGDSYLKVISSARRSRAETQGDL
jgi:hypothetical protein